MAKLKMTSTVVSQEMIATDIYSLWLRAEEIAVQAKPGQFISVYCKDSGKILPRPISICEIDKEKGMLRIVYRIAGEGTKEFSSLVSGDTIDILGPLGNGFPMEEVKGKKVFMMGGGIGIPPMVQTAKEAEADVTIIAGYRNSEIFLQEDLEKNGRLVVATEDGSVGTKGNVMDAIRENNLTADVILPVVQHQCCVQSRIMLRKIISFATFLWKKEWHAEWVHVWRVYVNQKK